jgi:hypothetical protein
VRAGRFYAQLAAADGKPHRYRLDHVETVPQAVLARQALKLKQAAGQFFPPAEMARLPEEAQKSEEAEKAGPEMRIISRIYAHLNEKHRRQKAAKLDFNTAKRASPRTAGNTTILARSSPQCCKTFCCCSLHHC